MTDKLRELVERLDAIDAYTDIGPYHLEAIDEAAAALRELIERKKCAGVGDSKCSYLAHCGCVCNKCGKVHDGLRTTYLREHLEKR